MSGKTGIAVIGCGNFAKSFVPLFKAHPYIEKVYVCDVIRERAEKYSMDYKVDIIPSYEEALKRRDIGAVAIFAQRHLHGPFVMAALKNGKHVYSAVPMASTPEECSDITALVEKTGLIYMMGETCYYYPCAMFCREIFSQGRLGDFLYGASQYYHHVDYISYGNRPGEGGMPPLLYPTHSTGMILAAAGSYATKVVAFGYEDKSGDGRFGKGNNYWDNPFSNEYVFMKLANGGTARVTEARSFGWFKPSSFISSMYGTGGGYEFSNAQHILVEKDRDSVKEKVRLTDVSDYINTTGMVQNKNLPDFKEKVANGEWQGSYVAKVQEKEISRLPESYAGLPNGHMGTHKFLVDDFCKAVYTGKIPALNAWAAARYTIPGLVAHKSALSDGLAIDVPDCGGPKA